MQASNLRRVQCFSSAAYAVFVHQLEAAANPQHQDPDSKSGSGSETQSAKTRVFREALFQAAKLNRQKPNSLNSETDKLAFICYELFYHNSLIASVGNNQDDIDKLVDKTQRTNPLFDENGIFNKNDLLKLTVCYAKKEFDERFPYGDPISLKSVLSHVLFCALAMFAAQCVPLAQILGYAAYAGALSAGVIAPIVVLEVLLLLVSAAIAFDLARRGDTEGAELILKVNAIFSVIAILLCVLNPSSAAVGIVVLASLVVLAALYSHRKSQIKPKAEREQCSLGLFAQKHNIHVPEFKEVGTGDLRPAV